MGHGALVDSMKRFNAKLLRRTMRAFIKHQQASEEYYSLFDEIEAELERLGYPGDAVDWIHETLPCQAEVVKVLGQGFKVVHGPPDA